MDFDKYIQDKLENYSSPVSERVWERIIAEQKKNKLVFFESFSQEKILFFIGLLLITATLGMFIMSKSNNSMDIYVDNEMYKNNITLQKKYTSIEKRNFIAFNKITQEHTSQLSSFSNNYISGYNKILNTSLSENTAIENTSINTKTTNAIINIVSNDNDINSNNIANSIESSITNKIENNSITISHSKELITPIATKQIDNLPLIATNKLQKKIKHPVKPIECPGEYSSYKNNWYVEGFVAPELVRKTVSGTAYNQTYLLRKDSAESMVLGATVGARFTRGLSKNFYVRAGVQYSQLIERVRLQQEKERKEVTIITIRTETDPLGNVTTVADTSKQLQIVYGTTTKYNSYKNIELPISLGYEFYNNNFRISANAGVIVKLASWYRGNTIDTSSNNNQLINIKDHPGVYNHNVGLSLFGSISLIKPLSETAEIFAEPYFRYDITNPKLNNYGFKQKFSAVGVALGLRFKLNNNTRTRFFQ